MMNRIRVRQWMIEVGLTQAQLAKESRLSRPYVSQVIAGTRRNALINTLLRGHGCPAEYLPEPSTRKAS